MKLLLIAHEFAGSGNMGSIRLRRLVKGLAARGHSIEVLTVRRPSGRTRPWEGAERVEAVRALCLERQAASGAGAAGPVSRSTRLSWLVNRWLLVPDKFIAWYGPAVRAGRRMIAARRPDLIFVSIEPRTDALVAARLAGESGVPLAVEYRDLWNGNPYYHLAPPTRWHARRQENLEQRVLQTAQVVTCLSPGIRDRLRDRFPGVPRMAVNLNFFVPEEFPARRDRAPGPFTIGYAGAFYGARSPQPFLEGMAEHIRSAGLTPADIRFRWMGPLAGLPEVGSWIAREGLEPFLTYEGTGGHREALQLLLDSDAVLVVTAPGDEVHIPGKLFEAFGARRPVLLMSHSEICARLLEEVRGGVRAGYEAADVRTALERLRGTKREAWYDDESALARHGAPSAITRFEEMLLAVVKGSGGEGEGK